MFTTIGIVLMLLAMGFGAALWQQPGKPVYVPMRTLTGSLRLSPNTPYPASEGNVCEKRLKATLVTHRPGD